MEISENLKTIRARIAALAQKQGGSAHRIELIAVSKKQPQEKIQLALQAGQRCFGENRVQEAYARWQNIKPDYPDLQLHLIGQLQTNKTRDAVALFDVIQTLEREKLALALRSEMEKQGRYLPCLIQVNTGDEPQKAGISPQEIEDFLYFCRQECALDIQGLMCIPPVEDPPALHFALLKRYADELNLPHLSMGMSGEYEKAIPLGATYIRLGTAIFGPRQDD